MRSATPTFAARMGANVSTGASTSGSGTGGATRAAADALFTPTQLPGVAGAFASIKHGDTLHALKQAAAIAAITYCGVSWLGMSAVCAKKCDSVNWDSWYVREPLYT